MGVQNVPILNQNKQNFKIRENSSKFEKSPEFLVSFKNFNEKLSIICHNQVLIDKIDLDVNILTV